ncbi:MAG: CcoQ/FixQ family Cbb3-type cytochrome c oxidase assembly chaperone [Usitatibacter sp.]
METINLVRVLVTVASFAAFVSIVGFVAWPANRRRFEQAAQLPPDEAGQ